VITHDQFGGYGYGELNELSKMIPKKEDSADPKTLKQAYEETPDFRKKIDESHKYGLLYRNSLKIEGLFRSSGAHAAGIIISGKPLPDLVPVGWDDKADLPVCQYNMKAAETAGLVKFDFLGLKTLSVIREALAHIKRVHGVDIDMATLPLDDADVYDMVAKGMTTGVFQFESNGMKNVLRQVKPTRIEDLIAVNALFRPGPMDMIPLYGQCKNGQAEPHYPEPVERTKPFLEETFGIMVYQEQVMQVAQVVAGYSLGGADLLRRAMGKKIPAEMAQQREAFVKGATERGTPEKAANELFDHIAKFAGYGFNKSHAAAYAVIAYRTAWLKKHYPVEFFSALMSYETKPERMQLIKEDLDDEMFGIELLPPDVNHSVPRFAPERKADGTLAIRFGLNAVQQISGDLPVMMKARQQGGAFASLIDFHKRAGEQFNKAQIERLAESGAFDCIAKTRAAAVSVLSWLAKSSKGSAKQDDLFGGALEIHVPDHVSEVAEWGNAVDREFKSVGFYFNKHPIDPYLPKLKKAQVKRRKSIVDWMATNGRAELKLMSLCGMVETCGIKISSRGNAYISAMIQEKQENYTVMFFANNDFTVDRFRTTLEAAKASRKPVVIVADFALERGGDGVTLFGKEVWDVDEYLQGVQGGDIVIGMDPERLLLSVSEQKMQQDIDEGAKRGTITAEEAGSRSARVRENALARKIKEIQAYLAAIRDDEAENAIKMTIMFPHRGKKMQIKMEGRYRMDTAAESALKGMDGIGSMMEVATAA
jgi:DNA polymerase-3 subunit alpha